jgi:drug/metabolite transporter (DMT)-like permease
VVLASTTPIFAFLITWGITRHEPATLLKLVGAILGLAGTAAIIGLDALGGLSHDIFAEIVILLATLSFACATISGCASPSTIQWWWPRDRWCSAVWCCCRRR